MLVVDELKTAIQAGDAVRVAKYITEYNLTLKETCITATAGVLAEITAFWDKRQLVKKINLNSLDIGRVYQ